MQQGATDDLRSDDLRSDDPGEERKQKRQKSHNKPKTPTVSKKKIKCVNGPKLISSYSGRVGGATADGGAELQASTGADEHTHANKA